MTFDKESKVLITKNDTTFNVNALRFTVNGFTSQSIKLKLLGLYLDTLIIGHTLCNIISAPNE